PHTPPVRAAVHLEHRDPGRGAGRQARRDLVIRRLTVRKRQLVIEAVAGQRREAAEADLEPLVGAVRALLGTADSDPAGDVTGEDVEPAEWRHGCADTESAERGGQAVVAVAAR